MKTDTTRAVKDRVLIVDDTPDNVWILAEVLKEECTIMVARNGTAALEAAHGTPQPDLILLDVLMPGMDGYEVCRILKSTPPTQDIPVIFVTSQDESGHEEQGLTLGAADYIRKPFVPSLVRMRVSAQLELKRHRDNLSALVRERTRELELTQQFVINALATLAEWRDAQTGEHIRRTRSYVSILAEELRKAINLEEMQDGQFMETLPLIAPLHDIGKVCVPDSILLKPASLTAEEFEIMKQHTVCARNVLDTAAEEIGNNVFLRIARELSYSHHERWDGKGYPEGLNETEIPLVARIMAVADVYDALTSHRVYKLPMPHEEAVQIIQNGSGTQFDAQIVDAFLKRESEFRLIMKREKDTAVRM